MVGTLIEADSPPPNGQELRKSYNTANVARNKIGKSLAVANPFGQAEQPVGPPRSAVDAEQAANWLHAAKGSQRVTTPSRRPVALAPDGVYGAALVASSSPSNARRVVPYLIAVGLVSLIGLVAVKSRHPGTAVKSSTGVRSIPQVDDSPNPSPSRVASTAKSGATSTSPTAKVAITASSTAPTSATVAMVATTAAAPTTPTIVPDVVAVSTTATATVTTVAAGPPTTIAQITTDVPLVPADALGAIESLKAEWAVSPGVPLIITYHDIAAESPSVYAVTPAAFAEQMATLEALGVHTLTSAEFNDYLAGRPIPARSILVTFDDGTRGVWRFADTIMAQHNFHGVSAVVTGFVGTRQPYYMTWDEIGRLAATGRWDFENHTHLAHTRVPLNAAGDLGSFLGNLAWLPAEQRMETVAEFKVRVGADLDQSIAELTSRGYGGGRLFAFPFSDYGTAGNDPAIAGLLAELTTERFIAVFNDDSRPLPLNGPFQFNRLNVTAKTTPAVLIEGLRSVLKLTQDNPAQPPA
jgi:peptidoglycan/xylan/chitin deacetylase (PgdA/CDA1 family)